jgi:hypothetical protein
MAANVVEELYKAGGITGILQRHKRDVLEEKVEMKPRYPSQPCLQRPSAERNIDIEVKLNYDSVDLILYGDTQWSALDGILNENSENFNSEVFKKELSEHARFYRMNADYLLQMYQNNGRITKQE